MSEEVHERFSSPIQFLFLSSPLPLFPVFGYFHWFWLSGGSAGVVWLLWPFCAFSQLVLESHHPSHCWCPLERCSGRGPCWPSFALVLHFLPSALLGSFSPSDQTTSCQNRGNMNIWIFYWAQHSSHLWYYQSYLKSIYTCSIRWLRTFHLWQLCSPLGFSVHSLLIQTFLSDFDYLSTSHDRVHRNWC